MSEKSSGGSAGIGIGGLLFVVLFVGKLAGFFPNLSWVLVITSIIWGPLIGFLVVLLFLGVGALVVVGGATVVDKIQETRRVKLLKKERERMGVK